MAENKQPNPSVWLTVKRVLGIAGGQRFWLFAALGVTLIQVALSVSFSHFMRRMFEAVSAGSHPAFWTNIWIILAITVLAGPMSYLKTLWVGLFSERTLTRIRRLIAEHSVALPVGYLEERNSGDFISVLNADLGKVKTLTASNMLDFIWNVVSFVAALTYIISVSWQLTLVSTLSTPLIFILVSALTKPVQKGSEEMQNEIGKVNSVAQDSLAGLMVVKAFNLVEILNNQFNHANRQALARGLRIARLRALIDAVGFALSMLPFIIAMGYGGYLVVTGVMTFGALFAFINLLNYVVNPLGNLPNLLGSMSEASGAAQRVFQLIDYIPERTNGKAIKPAEAQTQAIHLNHLSFGYEKDSPILKDVNISIEKGKRVAIVGPSGGGKSTLLKLLLGYYPLPDSYIYLFGADLNTWQLKAARQQMAYVAQDTYLFPISIAENIRLGRLGASQADVELAAHQANIHDFIVSLPEGYKTLAGERGARLSGGQRQRISLARAILKNAPILLLDEATSALDTESEALVQEALERFMVGRTTVVIAHRLSTIKNADRVLVLDDGKIVEEGTHAELIARGGLYQDLYQRQFALDQVDVSSVSRS
jgi:ABC-type multidrug transport system fused ATPase/permease subunit